MSLQSQQERTARLLDTLDGRMLPIAQEWYARCGTAGYRILVHQARRIWPEQDGLYAKGRTAPGEPCRHSGTLRIVGRCDRHPMGLKVTNARGGDSYHNYGLALDFVALGPDGTPLWDLTPWETLGDIGEALGLEWGGRWKSPDRPHLQLSLAPIAVLKSVAPKGFIPASWTPPPPAPEVA